MRKAMLAMAIMISVLYGCATSDVFSDQDQTVDFRSYQTFAWLPTHDDAFKNNMFNNQIVENNVKDFASRELMIRRLKVDTDSPDLIMEYSIMIEKKERSVQTPVYQYPYNYNLNANPYAVPYRRYMYDNYNNFNSFNYNNTPYFAGYKTENIPYTEGTLTISAIDRRTNRLVWRGWSVGTVTDPESYEGELQKDINGIFKKFPLQMQEKK